MGLFGTKKVSEGSVAQVTKLVENFFNKIRFNPHQQQIPSAKGYGWWIGRGSAVIYIFVQEAEGGGVYLRVVSPLVYLPKENLIAFYRKLLDINNDLVNCALATDKDVVLLVVQRPTLGLDQEELDDVVSLLAQTADSLDNELNKEFGCRVYSEQPK
jgi:hypothetical protein